MLKSKKGKNSIRSSYWCVIESVRCVRDINFFPRIHKDAHINQRNTNEQKSFNAIWFTLWFLCASSQYSNHSPKWNDKFSSLSRSIHTLVTLKIHEQDTHTRRNENLFVHRNKCGRLKQPWRRARIQKFFNEKKLFCPYSLEGEIYVYRVLIEYSYSLLQSFLMHIS
jgi:hypothetical protein